MDLAARLKACRLQKKLSMGAVAKALDLKSWQAVQQWEHSRAKPSRENLDKLAALYGVPMEYPLHGRSLARSKPAKLAPSDQALKLAASFDMLPPHQQRVVLDLITAFDAHPPETGPTPLDALNR